MKTAMLFSFLSVAAEPSVSQETGCRVLLTRDSKRSLLMQAKETYFLVPVMMDCCL